MSETEKVSNVIRVEFENELGPQWFEMRVFRVVPWSLTRRLQSIGGEVKRDESGKPVDVSDEGKLRYAEVVVSELVVNGHVLNAWTGEPMKFPSRDEDLRDAPAELLALAVQRFGELKREADEATKKS